MHATLRTWKGGATPHGGTNLANALTKPYNQAVRFIIFDSEEEQAKGLQYRQYVEAGTLFIFPRVHPGSLFHSRNVREDFDLAFVGEDLTILAKATIHPQAETMTAPEGTFMALESKAGEMSRWGFEPGLKAFLGGPI